MMNVVIPTEYRFRTDSLGRVVSASNTRSYSFWRRYLDAFGSVTIVGRLVHGEPAAGGVVEGPNVSFRALPDYLGPKQYLGKYQRLRHVLGESYDASSAYILRLPGQLGSLVASRLRSAKHPYAVEVVGDPHDVFAPGVVNHPVRPFLRWHFTREQKRQCAGACGAAYVTKATLQPRYPCPAHQVGVSDVELSDDAFAAGPRSHVSRDSGTHIVTVGSLAQLYKGTDTLLDAVALCVRDGVNVSLTVVGDGKYRSELEDRAKRLDLDERVRFTGALPRESGVRRQLDDADLFVLPSRTEGLPRAIIEAMARGLPCIATAVGGIPELLPAQNLVLANSPVALAEKIREVVTQPDRMTAMSERNLMEAQKYRIEILDARRSLFYHHVRQRTEEWLTSGK